MSSDSRNGNAIGNGTRTEQALRASELSYRRLFEAAKDGILILDFATGCVTDANPYLCKMLGYSHSEMVGQTVGELSPFKDVVANQAMWELLQKHGYVRYEDLPLETKDGRKIAVEFVSNVYQAGDKKVIQCNIRDLTERKKSEQQLQQLNTELVAGNEELVLSQRIGSLQRTALESIANAVVITNVKGNILWVNPAFTVLTGYSCEEVIGKNPRLLKSGKHDRNFYKDLWATILTGKTWRGNFINRRKDGALYHDEHTITPVRSKEGVITHFVAIMNDVTERKRGEQALYESQQVIEGILNAMPVRVFWKDANLKYLGCNMLFASDAGFADQKDLIGKDDYQMGWRDQADMYCSDDRHVIESGCSKFLIEETQTTPEGKTITLLTSKVPLRNSEDEICGMLGTYLDITDRKRAEEQIAEQAAFLDKARDAILVRDLEGIILYWNKGAERIYGWSSEEAIGRNILELLGTDPKKFEELNRLTISQGEWIGELHHLTKDRQEVTSEVRCSLIRDDEGRPKSILAINSDITEKKKLEAQFLRAQRMESIGMLAGGISHDLNNILAPIMMSIDILKTTSDSPETKQILDTIEVSAKRGADIVRQVLTFARGMEGERIEVQPKHLLNDLENIIKDTFPKNIRLQFSIPNDTWTILGDPTQVHQVLLNLCVNARDAIPNGGDLIVGVENCVIDEQYAAMNLQAKTGRYVKISVTDSGTGIPPDILDKIFEPFFTTKELNKGTGLGLSTVMAIVKSHEGVINVWGLSPQHTVH
jgi:PAS domain S-box-containing protein